MIYKIALTCLLSILIIGCTEKNNNKIDFQGHTMGTQYHVTVVSSSLQSIEVDNLKKNIDTLLDEINQQMSTYIADSQISNFNRYDGTDWFTVSTEMIEVIKAAQKISQITKGAFDITIAPLIDLWGFGAIAQYQKPSEQQREEIMKYTGYQLLETRTDPPALRKKNKQLRIDLSAIAKGFAVDKISMYLTQRGLTNHLVEIGGEIHASGTNYYDKKWRIAVENPNTENGIKQTLEVNNKGVATSGDYRNYFVQNGIKFSHTLNPKTGAPVKHKLTSVTVLNNSTMLADAYATALIVMGEERGKSFSQKQKLEVYMIINDDGTLKRWNTPNK